MQFGYFGICLLCICKVKFTINNFFVCEKDVIKIKKT